MIDLGRDLSRYVEAVPPRRDAVRRAMGRELRGSTLGVIGFGQIGQHLADLAARPLACASLVSDAAADRRSDATRARSPLPALLAESDFVVCLAPASAETENLLDAAAFAAMKPGAFFVNAARGELVDDAALLAALDAATSAAARSTSAARPTRCRRRRWRATRACWRAAHGRPDPAGDRASGDGDRGPARPALLRGELPPGAVNAADARRAGDEKGIPDMTAAPLAAYPGACDCHMHVFEDRLPLAPTATFKPPHAPAADYREVQQRARPEPRRRRPADRLRLRQPLHPRGDGRARARGARRRRRRAGRIARPSWPASHGLGVRGVRFMMLPGGVLAWAASPRPRRGSTPLGWHVDLQLDGRDLPQREAPLLALPCRLVIDHIGKLPRPDDARERRPSPRSAACSTPAAAGSSCRRRTRARSSARPTTPTSRRWRGRWPSAIPSGASGRATGRIRTSCPRPPSRRWSSGPIAASAARPAGSRILVDNPAELYGF